MHDSTSDNRTVLLGGNHWSRRDLKATDMSQKTKEYTVVPVTRLDCAPFIMGIHYAKRWPSISYAFGLMFHGELVGVVTYGTPASAPLRNGIAGAQFKVIELNRLCLTHNKKNEASILVGRSLKLLPNEVIVVSFADTDQGHIGYVYQACNFIYTGLSAKRTDWKVRGKEHLHGQTIADEFRGVKNRAESMREKYGDDFYLKPRARKHRYLFFTGCKQFRRAAMSALNYQIQPYPKTIK